MLIDAIRLFWAEPREPNPPERVWRDWLLVGVLAALVLVEAVTREEIVWRAVSAPLHFIPVAALLWRRTHPLLAVALAWSVIAGLDIAAIAVGEDSPGFDAMVGTIVFPYALFRWGSGREATIGLAIMTVPHVTNMIFFPSGVPLTAASFAFLLLPSTLGAAVRFRNRAQVRAVTEAKMFEREQLARELHDTVAHHVSAIAIQAQAGSALAASDPSASAEILRTIKTEASRTLAEMRTIVGALRTSDDAYLPKKRLDDMQSLVSNGVAPFVDLELSGQLEDVDGSTQAAVFRIAQEATTNALRHARRVQQILIKVEGRDDEVLVSVVDDGDASYFDPKMSPGYGLVGMLERASLHGGSLEAGPNRGRGWTVRAVLPKQRTSG